MLYHILIWKYCPILLLSFHFLKYLFLKKTQVLAFCANITSANMVNRLLDNLQEMWQALTPQSGSVRRVRILHLCEKGGAVIGTEPAVGRLKG